MAVWCPFCVNAFSDLNPKGFAELQAGFDKTVETELGKMRIVTDAGKMDNLSIEVSGFPTFSVTRDGKEIVVMTGYDDLETLKKAYEEPTPVSKEENTENNTQVELRQQQPYDAELRPDKEDQQWVGEDTQEDQRRVGEDRVKIV